MNRLSRIGIIIGLLAAALAVPIAAANVIFVYQAQVTVKPVTPVVFLKGPDASAVSLSLTNKTSPQVTLTIPITNSSETYVYQALAVKVNAGSPTLYVDSCSYSGLNLLTSVKLIVYQTSGSPSSPTGTIIITPSTSSGCTASGYVQLTAGQTYYVDFQVEPTLPIPYGASSGTLTIYFGLTNESAVTVPTP
ncbi:hypothetical protein [Acidilobus sp. 7A]|uniref:hypothetical protein n=1 Tax=Acidilobus sp. 7A TaxID=1577685 RepID=UPI000764EA24|nr:hypothetical protein [Acidilobus sp. 7A]AMD30567.1 hypothetical protein SE86_03570 [Acidilobus sp. 7A]